MSVRIGDRGIASTVLKPGGFVIVAEVRHPARCLSGFLEASTEVIVVSGDNLGLIVCAVESVPVIAELRGHGPEVHSSFGAKIASVGKASEQRRIEKRERAVRRSWIVGGVYGLTCSLAAACQLQPSWPVVSPGQPWLVPALMIAVGSVWGLIVGRCMCAAFEQVENHPNPKLTYVSTIVTLTGTTAAVIYVLPARGIWVGLATALSTTVILGAALPALALVVEWLAGDSGDVTTEGDSAADTDADSPML